jgi:maleamate amidohydrolase
MEMTADYAGAGFGGELGFGRRPALLLVDMAMAYFTPVSPLWLEHDAMLATNIILADAARAAGVPVIFTRVEYAYGGDGGLFYRKVKALRCFDAGNPLGEFHPDLMPLHGDIVITKQYPSAFFGTALAANLTAMAVDTVVVTGLSTSGCVRASALDALCHGFRPVVVKDACADRSAAIHDANLFDLQAKYADVVESAAVLEQFRASAST